MNCIVIDDEETSRAIVLFLAENNPEIKILDSFHNATSAIKYLNDNSVDLIFLNIHMPMFTGFDFIKTIKNPPKIILTSLDKAFALDAFEYKCIIDYLVKPITQERFDKSVEKALSVHREDVVVNDNQIPDESIDDLYVSIDRRLVKIDIPTIYLIEAKGDYIMLKTSNKNYMVHSTLKKIEDKLPNDFFLRVHRSYVINTKRIIDIEDSSVLVDKDVVPVSRSYRKELLERLNLL
ncbi:LytTR family two component transcriptional regulator [Maribacter vaceletii]|uniref:LytTR family two component transcriptional regulator n=1 Tax=Maribacter vaceletii TaxID=1206816 RepID=A0A495EAD2_9FLAO|nr:LytTR family DNA-binding domain-containing protein [Maribacter vaceletii]RKR12817.1 LytTR family two component transcriptional regulator [Maribacter vaceletii]